MKTPFLPRLIVSLLTLLLGLQISHAQPAPGPNPNQLLNSWGFSDTNWLSAKGNLPVAFTNLISVFGGGNGNDLSLDTTNVSPAYLFYRIIETNGSTNLTFTNGSISLWFSPDWSSTNQGGSGPGAWGNLISVGLAGTNGPWWAWYVDPTGTTMYFSEQTNGGAATNFLTAPVSFAANYWYNLVLSYSRTNSTVYTNGILVTNGNGVSFWPSTNISFFAVGSDTNGFFQAGGQFDDLNTYNYQLDPLLISGNFAMYSIFYGDATPTGPLSLPIAPSTPAVLPVFQAVSGAGLLTNAVASGTCITSNKIWITNAVAWFTNGATSISFSIEGGSNGISYDVFGTTALVSPATNAIWTWLGQGYHCTNYTIANLTNAAVYLMLGTAQDSDQDGLTDAYEMLVSHTDPHNADTDGDGMLDGWEVVYGTNPLIDDSQQTAQRSNFTYDPVGRLELIIGVRSESLTNDFEGNVLNAQ
ncbi:MAG TPA: LamG-like jellyroll fold domain-containing protein [Verrucomicrobiae bacterium]|jgi:hypothetical protein|nr:LamG-like jellyroll fold domain-containing protein [Verrucomicrobiae bacterium]